LELAFANKSIRRLCESEALAAKALGVTVAKQLTGRLADLLATQCVNDLVAGNPCELDGALHGHMSITLCDGFKVVFCANHSAERVHTAGKVNWSKVTRIKIIEVKRYDS
jgi:plasmid maintenance system killer protein